MPHSNAKSASTPRRWWSRNWQIHLPQANLQPSQTSMADHFCKNKQQLKVANNFCRKAPPQMFIWALNMPLYLTLLTYQKMCVSTKKMAAGLAHKKYFKNQQIVKKNKNKNV